MATTNVTGNQSELRYLTPMSKDIKKKKYCRFKKSGIKYIDYKDQIGRASCRERV